MPTTQIIPILNEHTKDISKMKIVLLDHTDRLIKLEDTTETILRKLDDMDRKFDQIHNDIKAIRNDTIFLKENAFYVQNKLSEFDQRIFNLECHRLAKQA